jgi:hypothetical protein
MSDALVQEVIEHLEALPPNLQAQVLAYVRSLDVTMPQAIKGTAMLQFAGAISEADLDMMRQAIEQGCEQVDLNEW